MKVIHSVWRKWNGLSWFYSHQIIRQMEETGLYTRNANSEGNLHYFFLFSKNLDLEFATKKSAKRVHQILLMLLPAIAWRPWISCTNSILYSNQIHISSLHLYPSPNKSILCTGLNTITLLTFLSWKASANTIQFSSSFWKDQKIHLA